MILEDDFILALILATKDIYEIISNIDLYINVFNTR